MKTRTRFLIFVRPIGSMVWTQHMKQFMGYSIPWSCSLEHEAENECMNITDIDPGMCCHIVRVENPKEIDKKQSIRFADNDTKFSASE